jgi:hypothetical protein
MESIIRKWKVGLFISLVFVFAFCFRAYSQRSVKPEKIRSNSVSQVLESSVRWESVREITGRNDHPMITKAMKLCGLPGNAGHPWCAASMAEIHDYAGLTAPHSARVVDWFNNNLVWTKAFGPKPTNFNTTGMVGAIYYRDLGRYGHIVLITGQDKNNFYTIEGNTNAAGSREGEGFYKKIRSKESISALADYCVNGKNFIQIYDAYLQKAMKQ